MSESIFIPRNLRSAGRELRLALNKPPNQLSHETFLRAWSSVAYLFPGLHPDGFEDADSGWPPILKRFAAEAWRRADANELVELYCSDAAWCGLYDRMHTHTAAERARRLALAAGHGEAILK